MDKFLQINQASYSYRDGFALKDIDFSVKKGEFLGIIGPNGAGKTTLLKMLNRTFTPQKGQISLEGKNLNSLTLRTIAQKLSMVGQDIQLSFSLTVLDLVLMGRFPHLRRFKTEVKSDIEVAHNSLELTQTLALADRDFSHLSAGERQRIVLAKALAQEPELLLLDEPTAHLDIAHQTKVFDLLTNLNKKNNLTIIAVLHDLNLAAEYCDKLLLLDKGKIVDWGNSHQVLQYATIEKTYGTVVLVKENPITGKPYVLPVPGRYVKQDKD